MAASPATALLASYPCLPFKCFYAASALAMTSRSRTMSPVVFASSSRSILSALIVSRLATMRSVSSARSLNSSVLYSDWKKVGEGVTGVQTCALPISGRVCQFVQVDLVRVDRLQVGHYAVGQFRPLSQLLGVVFRLEESRGGSDWSSDVCSSDLRSCLPVRPGRSCPR